MKSERTPTTTPKTPAEAGDPAAAYIAQELPKARLALKRARMVGLALLVLVGGYISIISVTLVRFFQPADAAEVASGMVMQHIATEGPALVVQVEREIPLLIRQLPDYVIRELPAYRQEVEQALMAEFQTHWSGLSRDVGKELDTQLAAHQDVLKELLQHPNDRDLIRAALPNLELTITSFLTSDADGKVVQEHITDIAAGLKEIEKRMDRLAKGTNLTPEEQKARRSLAVLSKAIKAQTSQPDVASRPVRKMAGK